jgi:hypothetical protein
VGAAVIVASVLALLRSTSSAARRATGVAPRTTRRWLRWWRGPFVTTSVFVEMAASFIGVDRLRLPASIMEQIRELPETALRKLLGWLAPLTTASTPSGARFVRGLV